MKSVEMPLPTLRRMMVYYRRLKQAIENGEKYISSTDLGLEAGATSEQVRKDLSYLSSQGRSRVGYPCLALASIIEDSLGLVKDKEAVLVGAGNLGKALALYPGFAPYGFRITVLFDNNPKVIGSHIGETIVLPAEKLTNLVRRMMILIGIITTPASAAQDVAEAMVAGGIKAIWNFAPTHLDVPEDVYVKNMDLASELATVSKHIKHLGKVRHELPEDAENAESIPAPMEGAIKEQ